MNDLIKKLAISIMSVTVAVACIADESDFDSGNNRPRQREGRQNREGRGGNRGGNNWGRQGGRGGNNWGRQGGRGGFDRNAMMQMGQWMSVAQRVLAFESIREKFPKESAELDKAILDYEAKYAELAKKAEIEIPASLENNLLKLRAADTKAYTDAIKAIKENSRQNFNKLLELAKKHNIELFPARRMPMREGRNVEAPNKSRDNLRPKMGQLRKKYPEEMKKYNKLKNSDPAKAKELLVELMKRSESEKNKK